MSLCTSFILILFVTVGLTSAVRVGTDEDVQGPFAKVQGDIQKSEQERIHGLHKKNEQKAEAPQNKADDHRKSPPSGDSNGESSSEKKGGELIFDIGAGEIGDAIGNAKNAVGSFGRNLVNSKELQKAVGESLAKCKTRFQGAKSGMAAITKEWTSFEGSLGCNNGVCDSSKSSPTKVIRQLLNTAVTIAGKMPPAVVVFPTSMS
jgi:hypothetical protein